MEETIYLTGEEITVINEYKELGTISIVVSYKTSDGHFCVEYKPDTYLRLKSGQNGFLYIIFQLKYYDSTGTLCGTRDLPVLTYRIYNVSDDKPKFIVTKTFEIDNRDGKYTYPADGDENLVYIMIDNTKYGYDTIVDTSRGKKTIDSTIGYDYLFNADLYLNTSLNVLSPIPLKYLNFELAYDRGRLPGSIHEDDPEFVFEPKYSKPGIYTETNGNISAHFDDKTLESSLEFTLFSGSKMNEATKNRLFPIEVMNADGEDINGNHPKFVFVNGSIEVDNNITDPSGIATGAYLARELNIDATNPSPSLCAIHNNEYNAGWILEEQRRSLIRMYSVGSATDRKILAENIPNYGDPPLKTTGSRTSREDKFNDLYILEDTGED